MKLYVMSNTNILQLVQKILDAELDSGTISKILRELIFARGYYIVTETHDSLYGDSYTRVLVSHRLEYKYYFGRWGDWKVHIYSLLEDNKIVGVVFKLVSRSSYGSEERYVVLPTRKIKLVFRLEGRFAETAKVGYRQEYVEKIEERELEPPPEEVLRALDS